MVGDPGRAERAAGLLDDAERVASNREYATYTGRHKGRRITVASHGVGAAGAGVCFEELARAGVESFLRVGTCGALRDDVNDGDLIVATAAVRDEGLTPRLVPLAYPAVADAELTVHLGASAAASGAVVHRGMSLSTDLFYPSKVLGPDFERWQAADLHAVEMELAALYVIASLHGCRAAGLLVVDGNPTRAPSDMSEYDPYRDVVREATGGALRVALDALATFPDSDG